MKVQLIGIAGGTCSGKTTLLNNLKSRLATGVSTLTFDEYFIGSDLYNLDNITNFEDPKLYNYSKFIDDLRQLKSGQSLVIRANSRESSESDIKEKIIASKPIIVVEGFLIFHNPAARELFDKRIFIELPDDVILSRRFARTRGTKHWDSHNYIQNKIIPYHHKYVEPQRNYADYILNGIKSQEEMLEEVINFLKLTSYPKLR
jgi:uridine kinase